MKKKFDLGKGRGGLNTLIPASIQGDRVVEDIPLDLVIGRPNQPRKDFDPAQLEELAASIRQHGVLQPILLNQTAGGYEIIAGERRWRAARLAGLKVIPALALRLSVVQVAEVSLVENLQRTDLSPLEEATAYQELMKDHGYTQEQLAENIGKSRAHIANTLRLLNLPVAVQEMLAARQITAGHARALLALPKAAAQIAVAKEIKEQGLSVRAVEKLVRQRIQSKTKPKAKPAASPARNPEWQAWEEKLQEHFGCKVSLSGTERGKIEIYYYDQEELNRILQLVGLEN